MRTRGSSKLTPEKRKELIIGLCRALTVLRSSEEVAESLTDLLTPKEIETIAKRLQIAEYLLENKDYEAIRKDLKVGYSTIARVNTWVNLSNQGFRIMLTRRKVSPSPKSLSEEEIYDPYSWHNIKRRYHLNFWPALVLGEFLKIADSGEKQKVYKIFDNLELKGRHFTSNMNRQLYEMFSNVLKSGRRSRFRK